MSKLEKTIEVMKNRLKFAKSKLAECPIPCNEDQAIHRSMLIENVIGYEQAVSALEEKAERDKGCEYCNDRKPLLDELGTTQIDGITGELWHTAQVSVDDIYEEHTDIKFCPMCGRKLDENDG